MNIFYRNAFRIQDEHLLRRSNEPPSEPEAEGAEQREGAGIDEENEEISQAGREDEDITGDDTWKFTFESCQMKPNLDLNYVFPVDLEIHRKI